MKRVFLETYGCQMNVADSETMAGVLERAGMELTARPEDADAVLLNTCAIREHAEQRVLGRLGEFARMKASRPSLVIGVAGCMAQHLRKRLLDGNARVLDLVVGPDGYRRLPELLLRAAGEPTAEIRLDRDETYGDLEPKREPGVRAWITVQRSHAVANGLPVVVANRIGFEKDPSGHTKGSQFWGSSFIAGPQGEIVAQAGSDKPEVLVADVDLAHSEAVRRIWPFLRDRRIDAYPDLLKRLRD